MNFDSPRADIRYWGWLRSLLIRVMSRLGKHTGLRVYRFAQPDFRMVKD